MGRSRKRMEKEKEGGEEEELELPKENSRSTCCIVTDPAGNVLIYDDEGFPINPAVMDWAASSKTDMIAKDSDAGKRIFRAVKKWHAELTDAMFDEIKKAA